MRLGRERLNLMQCKGRDMLDETESVTAKLCSFARAYHSNNDRNKIFDDFLAYGNTGLGIIDLCQQAGATIEGMGFIIEKAFQHGRELLTENGVYCIESLAIIDSLEGNQIQLRK